MPYKPYNSEWFEKKELTPPSSTSHGTEESIRENLKPLKTWGWELSGNQLSCETDQGKLVQSIDTGYICLGDDNNGRPILKKLQV